MPSDRSLPESREAEACRGHILIVDDEVFIRNSFRLYFETLGFRVSLAANGDGALSEFQNAKSPVDVVLLDLVMPGLHGIEILSRLKDLDSCIEVIIATGCGSMNTAIEALRYGAYDYVTKPIVNFDEDLLKVVLGALSSRKAKIRERHGGSSLAREGAVTAAERSDLSFFLALEQLAKETTEVVSQEARLKAVGAFLENQLQATAALLIETGQFGSASCPWRWGALSSDPDGELALSLGKALKELLARHKGWRRLEPKDLPSMLGGPLGAQNEQEALRIPLSLGEAVSNGASADLIVLGRPGSRRGNSPAPTALLSLVVSSALRDFSTRPVNF